MPRGFGSTLGAGSTDKINSRSIVSNVISSASVWVWINGIGGAGAGLGGRAYQSLVSTAFIMAANNTNQIIAAFPFSGNSGNFTFPITFTSGWQNIVYTYDASSTANKPTVYVNGATVAVTVSQAPTGTYAPQTGGFCLGNRDSDNARIWDGMLAHFAVWNGLLLSAGDALSLSRGVNPLLVQPNSLATYLPLDGINNPEADLILGTSVSITGTRRGTLEPPARLFVPPFDYGVTSIISAVLAAWQASDYAALTVSEAISAAIAAAQPADRALLLIDEIIGSAIVAAERMGFGALSVDVVAAASIAAYQQADFAALNVDEVVGAALTMLQDPDFALLLSNARRRVRCTLAAAQVNTATLSAVAACRAAVSASRPRSS